MIENIEGLNKLCGRDECKITNPLLCWGCLGDENNDDMYDDCPDRDSELARLKRFQASGSDAPAPVPDYERCG